MRSTGLRWAGLAVIALVATGCGVGIRGNATQITTSGALLNGRVVSTAGGQTSYYFEYGRDDPLQKTPDGSVEVARGFAPRVSARVEGLEPGGPYRFRVCAEDSENPGEPFCSPFRAFSVDEATEQDYVVGDFSNGLAHFVADVHADSSGRDPVGEVTADEGRLGSETAEVACIAVSGNRATIGVRFPSAGDGFFFFEDDPAGEDRFGAIPLATGQSVTDCSVAPPTLDAIPSGGISIHDALASH